MGRNLGRSSCCGNIVKLSDLRGKPIEFRRFKQDAPRIGTKWVCPTCQNNYFVIWSDPRQFASSSTKFNLDLSYYSSFSDEERYDFNQMAEDIGINTKSTVPVSSWRIIRAWQQKYPDKLMPAKDNDPAHLCLDDAEDVQDIL